MARCLLLESGLPKEFWTYAVKAAMYIRNRCYCRRTGRTHYELLLGRKPDLCSMHIFGSDCFGYQHQPKKLDNRSKKGQFVGYDLESPAYLVFYPDENSVRRVRNVRFIEDCSANVPSYTEIPLYPSADEDEITPEDDPVVDPVTKEVCPFYAQTGN